ncbi:MAG TPA: hypothetical protein HPP94_08895 [Desulfuromonadales bacterium]|nr:hypothetical protein [Desulfuromonadales bacterium]
MELKNIIWMNGSLEWFAYIGDEEVFLGKREVPIPLEEGDNWINEIGDMFAIVDSAIVCTGKTDPPQKYW